MKQAVSFIVKKRGPKYGTFGMMYFPRNEWPLRAEAGKGHPPTLDF
jgi:hypothetical protein